MATLFFSFLRNLHTIFFIVTASIYITNSIGRFPFLHALSLQTYCLQTFAVCRLFYLMAFLTSVKWYLTVAFDLSNIINQLIIVEKYIFSLVYWSSVYLSLEKYLFRYSTVFFISIYEMLINTYIFKRFCLPFSLKSLLYLLQYSFGLGFWVLGYKAHRILAPQPGSDYSPELKGKVLLLDLESPHLYILGVKPLLVPSFTNIFSCSAQTVFLFCV